MITINEEKFRAIVDTFYKGAVGALLVYDITSISSFEET
jgi:GTPase SAR1 family protein